MGPIPMTTTHPPPPTQQPTLQQHSPMEAALAAVNSVLEGQRTGQANAEWFIRGAQHAWGGRAESSDPVYGSRFTPTQKAALMGFCGVRRWKDIPKIWRAIEKTKTDVDLRRTLDEYWLPLIATV